MISKMTIYPDIYINKVEEITAKDLNERGIKALY